MRAWRFSVLSVLIAGLFGLFLVGPSVLRATTVSVESAKPAPLGERLKERNFRSGAPVLLRIFKAEAELEVWLERDGRFELFEIYPICSFSGKLGPKLKEGDLQSPEGFYSVSKKQLNPNSQYHKSFNIGFPNRYDRSHGRTGSYLMVHGGCVSIGCYAMTNDGIDEIYGLGKAALGKGQKRFPVHIFPFRMTEQNLALRQASEWIDFWQNLKEGYDIFEKTGRIPKITVSKRRYVFGNT